MVANCPTQSMSIYAKTVDDGTESKAHSSDHPPTIKMSLHGQTGFLHLNKFAKPKTQELKN